MCGKFETGHKCRLCKELCCNFCNTTSVEEMTDIVCPKCSIEVQDEFLPEDDPNVTGSVGIRGKGRPRKVIPSGQILIPLVKKKRGRPSKPKEVVDDKPKRKRGRPSKASIKTSFIDDTSEESDTDESVVKLSELRMMGHDNILAKVFVDEALTCNKPIETHMYDVHLAMQNPLPCYYCGEQEIGKISLTITDEKFPLCRKCQECGRGAAPRRKSRKLIPKAVKIPEKIMSKAKKMRKSLI